MPSSGGEGGNAAENSRNTKVRLPAGQAAGRSALTSTRRDDTRMRTRGGRGGGGHAGAAEKGAEANEGKKEG